MDFGPLEIVTAWRLTRTGVLCHAIVMQGVEGVRLVVIEDQRIVEWQHFRRIFDLRRHLARTLKARRQAGWLPSVTASAQPDTTDPGAPSPARRRLRSTPGLFATVETDL